MQKRLNIKMPFGLRALVSSTNQVLDGVQNPPWEGAILGGKVRPLQNDAQ